MEANPLKKYFRSPAIYIRLPSQGQYWPPGSIEPTENNEYPVLPMTTLDEINYRTPDALFNGSAVVAVIQSCLPNIKNAWHMPGMDIDPILVAIRIATYGHAMDIDTVCPNCATDAAYSVDLRMVLEQMKAPEYHQPMAMGDLTIYFRPMTYKEINDNSMMQFEDQKRLQSIEISTASDEEKIREMSAVVKKITAMSTRALAQSIAMVQTPQAQVTEAVHIEDWLANCDRNTFVRIKDHIIMNKSRGELQPLHITCASCQHQYDQTYTLDMSNFFAVAS